MWKSLSWVSGRVCLSVGIETSAASRPGCSGAGRSYTPPSPPPSPFPISHCFPASAIRSLSRGHFPDPEVCIWPGKDIATPWATSVLCKMARQMVTQALNHQACTHDDDAQGMITYQDCPDENVLLRLQCDCLARRSQTRTRAHTCAHTHTLWQQWMRRQRQGDAQLYAWMHLCQCAGERSASSPLLLVLEGLAPPSGQKPRVTESTAMATGISRQAVITCGTICHLKKNV